MIVNSEGLKNQVVEGSSPSVSIMMGYGEVGKHT